MYARSFSRPKAGLKPNFFPLYRKAGSAAPPNINGGTGRSRVNTNIESNGQECPFQTCGDGFRRTADSSLVLAASRL
jgi:hypothetical protein